MKKAYKVAIFAGVLAIVAIIVLIICTGSVPAGHTGMLLSYGKTQDSNMSPGFTWKAPWEQIVTLDNRVKTTSIATGTKDATTTDTAETKDQQLIPVFKFDIQHQLSPEQTYSIYVNYGKDYVDRLIVANGLQIIKETFAMYNADEIVTAKAAIPARVCDELNKITSPLGIEIKRVNFVTYDFSPEYTSILEQRALLNAQLENNQIQQKNETITAQTQYDVAVKQAEKEAETKRIAAENANEITIANAKAQAETDRINAENEAFVIRTKADAEKEARLAEAEAEKAWLDAQSSGLNDYIIQRVFIDKWDGKLIPNFGNGTTGIGFTNYTDIIEEYLFGNQKHNEE